MINAALALSRKLIGICIPIECMFIRVSMLKEDGITTFTAELARGFKDFDLAQAMSRLNFNHDNLMDEQVREIGDTLITGCVWLQDGSWLEREYSDRGWFWQHHKVPVKPVHLL